MRARFWPARFRTALLVQRTAAREAVSLQECCSTEPNSRVRERASVLTSSSVYRGAGLPLDSVRAFGHTEPMTTSILRGLGLAAATLGATLLTTAARADGMRCENRLVSNGDSAHEVRSKCGAPQATEHRTESEVVRRRVVVPCRTPVGGGACVEEQEHVVTHTIETWTYDFGPSRLVHYATFVDGKLRDVQTGGYGTRSDAE